MNLSFSFLDSQYIPTLLLTLYTVGENSNGGPKICNTFGAIFLFFKYYDSNIWLFSNAPHIVIALPKLMLY